MRESKARAHGVSVSLIGFASLSLPGQFTLNPQHFVGRGLSFRLYRRPKRFYGPFMVSPSTMTSMLASKTGELNRSATLPGT